jgi:hypothetical protein
VAVEKLDLSKLVEKTLRQEAVQVAEAAEGAESGYFGHSNPVRWSLLSSTTAVHLRPVEFERMPRAA